MTIYKECADHLRATYSTNGFRLAAGHAHELTAAYFGYQTGAALRAERTYTLDDLPDAALLIPNIALLEVRMGALVGLPTTLPSAQDVARTLDGFLVAQGHFSGEIWNTDNLARHIEEDFIQDQFALILDDVSGEIASTNAYFDELITDEIVITPAPDEVVIVVSGDINGDQDPEKPFSGNKIVFTTKITLRRVAGRIGFMSPELETGGSVDDSDYIDDEAA